MPMSPQMRRPACMSSPSPPPPTRGQPVAMRSAQRLFDDETNAAGFRGFFMKIPVSYSALAALLLVAAAPFVTAARTQYLLSPDAVPGGSPHRNGLTSASNMSGIAMPSFQIG